MLETTLNQLSTSILADVIKIVLSWLAQLSPVEAGMIVCGIAVLWFVKMLVQK